METIFVQNFRGQTKSTMANYMQPISRDRDDNAAMHNISGGRTKGANEKSFVFVHQHGGYDVT